MTLKDHIHYYWYECYTIGFYNVYRIHKVYVLRHLNKTLEVL